MLLHDGKELDDDLGRGSDKDLALALALSIDNAVKSVVLLQPQNMLFRSATCPGANRAFKLPSWGPERKRSGITYENGNANHGGRLCDLLGRYRQKEVG